MKAKKLIFIVTLLVTISATMFYSCSKDVNGGNNLSNSMNETEISETEKGNFCSCTASGLWSSCSISCPIKNGICLANCSTAGLMGIGWLGSVATCTCGTGTVGRYVVPDGVFYDDLNVYNLEYIGDYVKNISGFENFHDELEDLLGVIHETQSGDLVIESQEFFDEFSNLSNDQRLILKPVIADLITNSGRE